MIAFVLQVLDLLGSTLDLTMIASVLNVLDLPGLAKVEIAWESYLTDMLGSTLDEVISVPYVLDLLGTLSVIASVLHVPGLLGFSLEFLVHRSRIAVHGGGSCGLSLTKRLRWRSLRTKRSLLTIPPLLFVDYDDIPMA